MPRHDAATKPMPANTTPRDARPYAFLLAGLVLVADRLSKLWVIRNIPVGRARTVIPSVFRITHVLNTGAAFSLFEGSHNMNAVRYGLIAFSIVAALAVAVMLWRTGRRLTASTVAFALILGGAVGNLYDRIHLQFVIDFLEVHIGKYHYPDFNVADSAIVIGAGLLLLEALRPTASMKAE